jgi:hypothetical protein
MGGVCQPALEAGITSFALMVSIGTFCWHRFNGSLAVPAE